MAEGGILARSFVRFEVVEERVGQTIPRPRARRAPLFSPRETCGNSHRCSLAAGINLLFLASHAVSCYLNMAQIPDAFLFSSNCLLLCQIPA